jgi:formylglycine-generating enzyme required for sulfatase activity
MVPIVLGNFATGSNAPGGSPNYNSPNEVPVHQVTLSYLYWMGRYEVTQAEHTAVMGFSPSYYQGPGTNTTHPVETVSWLMARNHCAALTTHRWGLPWNLRCAENGLRVVLAPILVP